MPIENRGTFKSDDVIILLNDLTGAIEPKATEERECLIQSGIHYSEMLPLEYSPSEAYLEMYKNALTHFSDDVADAVVNVSERILNAKGHNVVLVSLARAGTPIGILIKHYLQRKHSVEVQHYTISIVRGRGIDTAAMRYILDRHSFDEVQFVDGWTGKGAILNELVNAVSKYVSIYDRRKILAVLADPANITDVCGTHRDIPIASAFLNSTVCGLMSRTILLPSIGQNEFHGVVFYDELKSEDRTYEFIDSIVSRIEYGDLLTGINEVKSIAKHFNINDINMIKPGIGEATRVLLRRVPEIILIAENTDERYFVHLIQLAHEKGVPVVKYPLKRYNACGIIKSLSADV